MEEMKKINKNKTNKKKRNDTEKEIKIRVEGGPKCKPDISGKTENQQKIVKINFKSSLLCL